jgi:hypothetical protein
MDCPVCEQKMIKSKVGHLCLNCGNLVEHGHSAIKPPEHEGHHGDSHHSEHHHEAHHHEETQPAPAKKAAPAKKSTGSKITVHTRTVSDIKRHSHG